MPDDLCAPGEGSRLLQRMERASTSNAPIQDRLRQGRGNESFRSPASSDQVERNDAELESFQNTRLLQEPAYNSSGAVNRLNMITGHLARPVSVGSNASITNIASNSRLHDLRNELVSETDAVQGPISPERTAYYQAAIQEHEGDPLASNLANLLSRVTLAPQPSFVSHISLRGLDATSPYEQLRSNAVSRLQAQNLSHAQLLHLAENTKEIEDPHLRDAEISAIRELAQNNQEILHALARRIHRIENPQTRVHEAEEIFKAAEGNTAVIDSLARRIYTIQDPDLCLRLYKHSIECSQGDEDLLFHLTKESNHLDDPANIAKIHTAIRQALPPQSDILGTLADHSDRILDPQLRTAEHIALRKAIGQNTDALQPLALHSNRIEDENVRESERQEIARAADGNQDVLSMLRYSKHDEIPHEHSSSESENDNDG
jgi:hypothetical protein